jgi:hypothetical protein
VVFLPFWLAVFLTVRLVRKHIVTPRIGRVKFGAARKAKLMKFNIVMLVMNVCALGLGTVAALKFGVMSGALTLSIFTLIVLLGATAAAYFLSFRRLYVYGLLVAFSPLVGEWLYANHGASHHGFPITFGTTAGIMILTGLVIFVRLLRDTPVSVSGPSSEEA